ncbi:hypothetical protein RUM43_003929 [Polyplax serrata]|uniref:Uncharacterized protein n=1 Tax=Polyplax serrata TaxID=468196 RepID=A0AAN8P381_POLSC
MTRSTLWFAETEWIDYKVRGSVAVAVVERERSAKIVQRSEPVHITTMPFSAVSIGQGIAYVLMKFMSVALREITGNRSDQDLCLSLDSALPSTDTSIDTFHG